MTSDVNAADPLVATFGRLLEAHSTLVRQAARELEARCDLPLTWFEVLLRISRSEQGRISMGALAQQVALTTGGVTRMLDRMVAAGLVRRVPCPTDRRVQFAELTSDGTTRLREATAVHAANLQTLLQGFDEQELRTLDALLDRLRGARTEQQPNG